MDNDTVHKVNARCFGRDEKKYDTRPRLNNVKAFISAVVDIHEADFACSCCIPTAGILDAAPEKVFLIATRPDRIAMRYAGCRYDQARGIFRLNINGSPIAIRVAGGDGFVFNSRFARQVVNNVCYTTEGIPVMCVPDFVTAFIHAELNLPAVYKEFFLLQAPAATASAHFKSVCGVTAKSEWGL